MGKITKTKIQQFLLSAFAIVLVVLFAAVILRMMGIYLPVLGPLGDRIGIP